MTHATNTLAPHVSLARRLAALGITRRGAVMLALADRRDAGALAAAIDTAGGPHALEAATMEAIAEALELEYAVISARTLDGLDDDEPVIAPRDAVWIVNDRESVWGEPMPIDADRSAWRDALARAEYEPSERSYRVEWFAEISLVTSSGYVWERSFIVRRNVHPQRPPCAEGHDRDHVWRSPHEVVGGLEENPGVRGNGGGVVIREVCERCGTYRITDTWGTDSYDGTPMETRRYEEADEASLAWVARRGEGI